MQTIKTAVVVVLLMVILYGAFIAMNGQETELPPDLENMIAMGPDFAIEGPTNTSPTTTEPAKLDKTSDSSPASSPFAGWPGSTTATSEASKPAAIEMPAPKADTSSSALLLPPSGSESEKNKTLDVEMPSVATPAATASTAGEQTAAPTGDPWLRTLQNSVASPSPKDAPNTAPSVPATLASTTTTPNANEPNLDSVKNADSTAPRSDFSVTSQSFENAKKQALEQAEKGKLKEGLQTLSLFYNSQELTAEQRSDLLDMLDTLAFEVIYSRRHLLDLPYPVAPGETLEQVAQLHEIPIDLLAKINGISNPDSVAPGTKLKVMKGPFRVEVNMTSKEMTLFLGDLYAGRFPVSTGTDPEPREGVFQIVDKQRDRNYYGPGGIQIGGNDPRNPYGGLWMDLGQQLSIHGTPENPSADTQRLGCISLSPIDAEDVFTMLSRGSQVTIRR